MTHADSLGQALLTAKVNDRFTEATLHFRDGSRLYFCHRVGERWAKALGSDDRQEASGIAAQLLSAITMFRLNAKHLDIQFEDHSRWDEALQKLV